MGANDAAEMLEVAKEEVGRLEREVDQVVNERNRALFRAADFERQIGRLADTMAEHVRKAEAERDAALAVIEQVREWNTLLHRQHRYNDLDDMLIQSPADALDEHDRLVEVDAWDEGHEAGRINEHEGREGRKMLNPYRKAGE